MRSVLELGASVPAFLGKLWKLVNDLETNHLISWSPGGKTFVIKNQADFARELLPLYYKHNNMASFIRQLNMYGFHKITSVENGGLRYEKDEIEFSHPCFVKNQSYLLEHIKRKIANPKTIVTSGESGEKILIKPELMNKVLTDVKQMKGKQESLDAKFSAMKQENEALWREVAILRQKHIKQQQIVNNLIQFLMSLVQPARPNNANSNNVGVKRPYQLMINSAAHNHGEGAYPGRVKNIKLDKDSILEDINEDNQEDGPTIHELAHDDVLHSEIAEDSLNPANFVSIDTEIPCSFSPHNPNSMQYQVTLEDGDEFDTGGVRIYPVTKVNSTLPQTLDVQPVVTSPSPTIVNPTSPLDQTVLDQVFIDPSTIIREKMRKTPRNTNKQVKKMTPANSFNNLNPAADPKLPADIFADDDSVENCLGAGDSIFQSALHNAETDPMVSTSKDKMFGGINIKVEKGVNPKTSKKSKKSNKDTPQLNLADIKTELQDDLDWNNMSLATVNNNSDVNRFNSMNKRDNISKNFEEYSSLFGTNSNKTDIDDHLDSMQTDIESLRELLRSDSYALDTNTLMGLFGSDDPFYGLSYNPVDERAKASNSAKKLKGEISNVSGEESRVEHSYAEDYAEGNQLMSYTGNMIPCLEDMNLELLENSQEAVSPSPSPSPSPSNCTLNTPQVQVASPAFPQKR
ncbi:heat shock factor protein-like isoform X2 [Choristoneura fumiferana]|uniref:heat shock factor protein-like isoform X2 n=1 Tax=Choristoneura fumiferana TaxID=7141 RepID=UPI003D15E78F